MKALSQIHSLVRRVFDPEGEPSDFQFVAGMDSTIGVEYLPIHVYGPLSDETTHHIQLGDTLDLPLIVQQLACGIYSESGKLVSARRTTKRGYFAVDLQPGQMYRIKIAPRIDDDEQREIIEALARDGDQMAKLELAEIPYFVLLRKKMDLIYDRRENLKIAAAGIDDKLSQDKPIQLFELLQAFKAPAMMCFPNTEFVFIVTGDPNRQVITFHLHRHDANVYGKSMTLEIRTVGKKENDYRESVMLKQGTGAIEFPRVPGSGIVDCRILLNGQEAVPYLRIDTQKSEGDM